MQLLHGGSCLRYDALLEAVGKEAVEKLGHLRAAPDDTGGAMLTRFLRRRPHLFTEVLGDSVQVVTGGQKVEGRLKERPRKHRKRKGVTRAAGC